MSEIPEEAKCQHSKWSDWGHKATICGKSAKARHDGRFYCGVHDPKRPETRRAASSEKWKAKETEKHARRQAAQKIIDAQYAVVDAARIAARNDDWGLVVAAVDRLVEAEGGQ